MDAIKKINAQVSLLVDLYQALAQQAQAHGHSISNEIVALLAPMLGYNSTELVKYRINIGISLTHAPECSTLTARLKHFSIFFVSLCVA